MRQQVIIFAVGFLLGGILIGFFFRPAPVEVEKLVTVTEVVEVEKIIIDTFYREEKPRPKLVEPSTDPQTYDSARTYAGSFAFNYGFIDWTAKTAGALDFLELKPRLILDQTTITHTTDTKTIKTRNSRGLYAGASMGTDLTPGLGATLQLNKVLVGYELQGPDRVHRLKVHIKIF